MSMTVAQPYYYRFSWVQLLRPMTLSGTITPICAASIFILWKTGTSEIQPFLLLLIGAVLIQMATNIWNDYFDFKKGQDKSKWQVETNGNHPAHHQLPYLASVLTAAAVVSGIFLGIMTTFWVIPIGIAGIIGGFCYSAGEPSLSQAGLGELTAALFLGFATTLLPFIIQDVWMIPEMFLIAVPFAILISTMILTNNIRDIEKDQGFRNTIAIILKRKKAIILLQVLVTFIYGWIFMLVLLRIIPPLSLLLLIGLPVIYKWFHCFKGDETDPKCMKYAAWHHWAFGLSFTAGLLISVGIM